MSKKILCKFFAHGACLKGEHCEFSHDWRDQANNICTFYQKGACSYGSRCRYEHVKLSRHQTPQPPPPPPPPLNSRNREASGSSFNQGAAGSSQLLSPVISAAGTGRPISGISLAMSTSSRTFHPPTESPWVQGHSLSAVFEDEIHENGPDLNPVSPADRPICSFAAAGNCPYGDMCPKIHGDLCSMCGKRCLHPFRPDESDEHIRLCQKNKKHLEALRHSQDIECSVCLDRVLSKPTAAERKFGLLSECDHPFCVSCIRNWRNNSPESGMDVNSALRACPICRKLSYFVIPSVIWYSSKEEKQEIIDNYKAKLRSIDCRHFDFGNGSCPFGTSCFYKHAYRDGRLEEVVLRHLDSEDGNTVIAKNIRLSDFFRSLQL